MSRIGFRTAVALRSTAWAALRVRFRNACPTDGLVVVDGVFLQRPELAGQFAFVIFLDVTFEEAARRMAVRDGVPADPDDPRLRRYTVAQRRYLAEYGPQSRADLVIDNTDIDNPVMTRERAQE